MLQNSVDTVHRTTFTITLLSLDLIFSTSLKIRRSASLSGWKRGKLKITVSTACLLYFVLLTVLFFYSNVQWCRWFAYLHMYVCFFIPAIDCTCVCIGCTPQLRSRRPTRTASLAVSNPFTCSVYWPVTRGHVTAAVFQTRAWFCDTFTSDFV